MELSAWLTSPSACELLDRAGELVRAGLQLGEQPRVLDGDGRLVGEGLHQRDLAVGERPDLVPVDDDHARAARPPGAWGSPSTVRTASTCVDAVGVLGVRHGHRECGWSAARGRRAPAALPRPGAMRIALDEMLAARRRRCGRPRLAGAAPSKRKINARSASHSRTAFSASVSKTGWRSKVDRPITLSSSLVAVCCSSATRSSLLRASSSVNRRTFSMAMTAWSAKVFRSSTCLGEEPRLRPLRRRSPRWRCPVAEHRHRRAAAVAAGPCRVSVLYSGSLRTSGICDDRASQDRTCRSRAARVLGRIGNTPRNGLEPLGSVTLWSEASWISSPSTATRRR